MNNSIKFGLLFVSLFIGSVSALADECLRRASNRDLIAELDSRLGGGNGGGSQYDSVFVSYLCQYDGDMMISLVNAAGSEINVEVDIDKINNCNEMAGVLSSNRSRISRTTVIGVCDYSGDMIRYSITPQGIITKISKVEIDDVPICIQQAAALNRG